MTEWIDFIYKHAGHIIEDNVAFILLVAIVLGYFAIRNLRSSVSEIQSSVLEIKEQLSIILGVLPDAVTDKNNLVDLSRTDNKISEAASSIHDK